MTANIKTMNHNANCQALFALIKKGQLGEASQHIKELLQQFPKQADYWHLYSLAAVHMRQANKAVEFSRKATELAPNNLNFHVQLASALQNNLELTEAAKQARLAELKLIETPTPNANLLDSLGTIYSHCGDIKSAQRLYEQAANLQPSSPHFLFNLATAYRGNGLINKAEETYNRVIALKPNDFEAYANRSQLRKQTEDNNHIAELNSLLDKNIPFWRDECNICFSLAKEYEDTKNHPAAFKNLKRGSDLRRKHMSYDVNHDLQAITHIQKTFTPESIKNKGKGSDSIEPIFILGLPRTGSTLVERILGSHSQVHSAGELQNFAAELMKKITTLYPNEKLDKNAIIEKSLTIDFNNLGNSYINSTRLTTGHTKYFIDKMPLNFLYIGLIKLALPNSKIIHLTRDPLDTCYAIYKTSFKDAYPYSYNLDDLGRYYAAYQRLMQHWHQLFPGEIFDINYETLVNHQKQESQNLIKYCNLPWEDKCLEFYNNPQSSMTASASQVRQPIYRGSINKWKNYAKELTPLISRLNSEGVKLS